MSISAVLEVGVGLILVYYVLSSISSAVTSKISELTELRAKQFYAGLHGLLDDSNKLESLLEHPWVQMATPKQVTMLGKIKDKKMDWLSAKIFSKAFLDVLVPGEEGKGTLEDLQEAIINLPEGKTKTHLQTLINKSVTTVDKARSEFEEWFNQAMSNVGSIYGQYARNIVLGISLILTVSLNVDTLEIGNSLWNAPTKRAVAVSVADDLLAAQTSATAEIADIDELVASLETVEIPLFWSSGDIPRTRAAIFYKIVGLGITWVAASRGSSFWYDVLKRLRGA